MLANVSIVIPSQDEEVHLPALLAALIGGVRAQVIVADGGSHDRTLEIARAAGARVEVIETARGRARQQNRGARAATRPWLWFLHADCLPDRRCFAALAAAISRPGAGWGAFAFKLDRDPRDSYLALIERLVELRTRHLNLPYGDQGLFVQRALFESIGGFDESAPCEDLDLVMRLRRRAPMTPLLGAPLVTSARAWRRHGRLGATWRHARGALASLRHHARATTQREISPSMCCTER